MPQPTSAESDDNRACFGFPAIAGKKFSAGFDGGRLTSDGGVLLLGQAERQMGIAKRLAACIARSARPKPRHPRQGGHPARFGCWRLLAAKMQLHSVGIAEGQDEACSVAFLMPYRAKNIG